MLQYQGKMHHSRTIPQLLELLETPKSYSYQLQHHKIKMVKSIFLKAQCSYLTTQINQWL
jgi:hypothetical protein